MHRTRGLTTRSTGPLAGGAYAPSARGRLAWFVRRRRGLASRKLVCHFGCTLACYCSPRCCLFSSSSRCDRSARLFLSAAVRRPASDTFATSYTTRDSALCIGNAHLVAGYALRSWFRLGNALKLLPPSA